MILRKPTRIFTTVNKVKTGSIGKGWYEDHKEIDMADNKAKNLHHKILKGHHELMKHHAKLEQHLSKKEQKSTPVKKGKK